MSDKLPARIAVSSETRDDLRAAKRDSERYEDVLRQMIAQYDPDEDDEG